MKTTIYWRLRPLYAAQFLQGFVLWYAIEKFFERSIGLNDADISAIVVIFTAAMMVANVPFGVLADRWSRKGMLVFSELMLVASSVVGGVSHSFWQYAVSGVLWGLFYAGYAGLYDSIVYDVLLEEQGTADGFERYYGRVQMCNSAALVAGSLLSSVAVHFWGLRATYFISMVPSSLAIFALVLFREPTLHRQHANGLIGAHLKATFKAIMRRGHVFWIVVCMVIIAALSRIMFELDQLWLLAVALPVTAYGPVNALLLSSIGVSGAVASHIKHRDKLIVGVGLLLCVSGMALLFHDRALIVTAEVVALISLLTLNIILGKLLHDTMPSNVRAGASSVVGTVGYLLFLPLGILFGQVSTHASVFRAAWIVVALAFAAFASLLAMLKTKRTPVLDKKG